MYTIFSKIIAREIPSYKIAEDEYFYSFLDIFPIRRGHTLIVPKVEVDHFFDLDNQFLERWLVFAKPIAKSIEKSFICNRCGFSVIGLEIPHAHMHLLPINTAADLDFTQPKLKLTIEELTTIQKRIIDNL